MNILYITTIGSTMGFFTAFIRQLLDEGHTVSIATNERSRNVPSCYREWGCKVYPLSCTRSPLSKDNLKAIQEIKNLVSENDFDIVHCHTPVAAMCTRIACRKTRKQGTRVFYTAHGFHFFKGAPLKNWLLYYPVEWFLARFTDALITINQEDYALAQKRLKAKRVVYVPGVGIDLEKFQNLRIDRNAKRSELGIPENAFLLLSVGELNQNKNHETVIRAIAQIPDVHYIIAGQGSLHESLQNLINDLGLADRVKLFGYRTDVPELCKASDLFVFPSFREGLSVSVMEAMACGLPVACSSIRGNTDLIDENGGVLFDPHSVEDCSRALKNIIETDCPILAKRNTECIKPFSLSAVTSLLKDIYEERNN